MVRAGDPITDGPINPQEYLETRGRDAVQRYLVKEVQRVYRSQGVTINDKHIEIIVRQMLRKVRIDQPGDSEQLPFELVDKFDFEEINNRVLAEGGEPATAETVLLGRDQGVAQHRFVPCGGVLPGDHPRADRGRHQRRQGQAARPQGERHHRQAHPGRDRARRRTSLRARAAARRAAAEALAGGELPEGFGEEINIFLADGDRTPGEDGAFNPLLAERAEVGAAAAADAADALEGNPFLDDADTADEPEPTLEDLAAEEESEPAKA